MELSSQRRRSGKRTLKNLQANIKSPCDAKRTSQGLKVWRWRELNPRPTMLAQVFSGCSSQCVVFGPSAHANESLTDLAA